jgi:hypothetical protein
MTSPCRRLLVVTLALEEALRQDAWSEAEALLRERGDVLEQIALQPPSLDELPVLERCREAEDRTLRFLFSSRASVAESLRQRMEGRRVAAAYNPRSTRAVSLDRAG